jgi:ADP-ribosylglycohydrolase
MQAAESSTSRRAWQIDRELRLNAVPRDRRIHPSNWYTSATVFPTGDDLIRLFWNATVPGSGAPEIPYVEMVESMANQGYDVRRAEALLPEGIRLATEEHLDDLRALTAELLALLHAAPRIPEHPYWRYDYPDPTWRAVREALSAADPEQDRRGLEKLEKRTLAGWLCQLAGGAFGTAIEGYHTDRIAEVYGVIDGYLTTPETMNDDVVYELVFLDVFERHGRRLTARQLGLEWVRQIPFGWSAEWIALRNLSMGIMPPRSGAFRNPYSDWIGAQMRGMVCGMLAPGWPLEAARLAHLDASVSHARNGIYGEMYAAVLTALAYVRQDERALLEEALNYIPPGSEYAAVAREILAVLRSEPNPAAAWRLLDARFEEYNWIHAYPNLAADMLALWHARGDLTTAFRWLAHAGLDVDCNAGLVGTVLGVMHGAPDKWAAPLGDLLETYLRGKERLSIRELAARTAYLAQR